MREARPPFAGTKKCSHTDLTKAKYGAPDLPIYRHVAPKVPALQQDVHRALLHICHDITKRMIAKGKLRKSADADLLIKGDGA